MMIETLWLNGDWMPLADGAVSVEDRAMQFGDGIYEVIAFPGGQALFLEEHLDRLEGSAAAIELTPAISRDERRQLILDLAQRSGGECMVYGQLTRGSARRLHAFPPEGTPPTELWYSRSLPQISESLRRDGVRLLLASDERWANCHIKSTMLLPNCMAKERARRAGCHDSLFFGPDGSLRETGVANFFGVLGGVLRTHPLTRAILPGVTRKAILQHARQLGISVEERALTVSDLPRLTEAAISSTTVGILPITHIGNHHIGAPGTVIQSLSDSYTDAIHSPIST